MIDFLLGALVGWGADARQVRGRRQVASGLQQRAQVLLTEWLEYPAS
jgi:hypothetical protein